MTLSNRSNVIVHIILLSWLLSNMPRQADSGAEMTSKKNCGKIHRVLQHLRSPVQGPTSRNATAEGRRQCHSSKLLRSISISGAQPGPIIFSVRFTESFTAAPRNGSRSRVFTMPWAVGTSTFPMIRASHSWAEEPCNVRKNDKDDCFLVSTLLYQLK